MAVLGSDAPFHARWLYAAIRNYPAAAQGALRAEAMTSEERREGRYRRRTAARAERKRRALEGHDDFEAVFSYENLYRAYRKCRRNVAWKASVQKYVTQAPLKVHQAHEKLMHGKWKSRGFYEFDLCERGKTRHIRAVNIDERVVHGSLCDNALVPVLGRTFIYDNAASLKRRGYHFAVRRCCQHLREHYKKHGNSGYILLFDFQKFFDNVSHRLCGDILRKEFSDDRIIRITEEIIKDFGDKGLGLGSPVSQTFALASANRLDHYVKEALRIRGYGRYMDDGYLIHESKEYLQGCLKAIKDVCKSLEITLHEDKTQIVRLSHGFTFLKARLYLTDTGKIIRKIPRQSVTRQRRKLKKLAKLLEVGKICYEDVYTSFQSWRAYAGNFNAWNTIRSMEQLYNDLFIWPWRGCSDKTAPVY